MVKLTKLFLIPFHYLIQLFTGFRRILYSSGILSSYQPDVKLIAVGNLRLGGTGKTPFVAFLTELLSPENKVAILSRGYKRKSTGYQKVNSASTPHDVGDEAIQLRDNLVGRASIHVCEKRVKGIKSILQDKPQPNFILLDDAYQHLAVNPDLNILLTTFDHPFYEDHVFPLGRLRESRHAAKHADLLIVTKCPQKLDQKNAEKISTQIKPYAPKSTILFSTVNYPSPINHTSLLPTNRVVLTTGIAHANPLENYLRENYDLIKHFEFSDHHWYKASDVDTMVNFCKNENATLFTTAKDITKLQSFEAINSIPVLVQPIEVGMLFDGREQLTEILSAN